MHNLVVLWIFVALYHELIIALTGRYYCIIYIKKQFLTRCQLYLVTRIANEPLYSISMRERGPFYTGPRCLEPLVLHIQDNLVRQEMVIACKAKARFYTYIGKYIVVL